jgi:5-methylcytosine-specific restriction protein A
MPIQPPRPCNKQGCRNKQVANGYCTEHYKARVAYYDSLRLSAQERGYDSTWTRLRNMYLRQYPICNRCRRASEMVHHKIPITKGGAVLDPDNLEALCNSCHDAIPD